MKANDAKTESTHCKSLSIEHEFFLALCMQKRVFLSFAIAQNVIDRIIERTVIFANKLKVAKSWRHLVSKHSYLIRYFIFSKSNPILLDDSPQQHKEQKSSSLSFPNFIFIHFHFAQAAAFIQSNVYLSTKNMSSIFSSVSYSSETVVSHNFLLAPFSFINFMKRKHKQQVHNFILFILCFSLYLFRFVSVHLLYMIVKDSISLLFFRQHKYTSTNFYCIAFASGLGLCSVLLCIACFI